MKEMKETWKLLGAPDGPVWSRHYSQDPDGDDCELLATTLEQLGAARMIVGHTVQSGGISSACNERVWRIDTGMSAFYGGKVQVLEIRGGEVSVLGD